MTKGVAELLAPDDKRAPPDGEIEAEDFATEPIYSGEVSQPPREHPAGRPKLGLIHGGKPLTPAQQSLVRSVRDLGRKKAHEFAPNAQGVELKDLFQFAMNGAVMGARRFNPKSETPFASYVVPWMLGAMKDARDKKRNESRLVQAGILAGRLFMAERSVRIASPIEEDEVSQARLDDIAERLSTAQELAMGFELPDPDEIPEERVAWGRIKQALVAVLMKLSARENQLLVLRLMEGNSYVEIAAAMDLPSEDAVRKRVEWLLDRLRRLLGEAGVNELPRGRYRP